MTLHVLICDSWSLISTLDSNCLLMDREDKGGPGGGQMDGGRGLSNKLTDEKMYDNETRGK